VAPFWKKNTTGRKRGGEVLWFESQWGIALLSLKVGMEYARLGALRPTEERGIERQEKRVEPVNSSEGEGVLRRTDKRRRTGD